MRAASDQEGVGVLDSGEKAGEAQHWTHEVLVGLERKAAWWSSAKLVPEREKEGGAGERRCMTLLISEGRD